MASATERQALIRQHKNLKRDLQSIHEEIRKLEHANEYLRRTNADMKLRLESTQECEEQSYNGNAGYKLSIIGSLSQATAAVVAATTEIRKQTLNLIDDFTKEEHYFQENKNRRMDHVLQTILKRSEMMGPSTPSLSRKESEAESDNAMSSADMSSYKPMITTQTDSHDSILS
uniref:Uncharacterized protein n=1 Tax=Babesia bovis TaxID=5865 RepID=S6B1S9_BABBO|nr:hypothetical protein [Babesia bovis]